MSDETIDGRFDQLVKQEAAAAEVIAALLEEHILALHFPAADGNRANMAAAVRGENGELIVVFTSPSKLAESTSNRGNLEPVTMKFRSLLETIPPDVGLLINPGCSIARVIEWPFIQEAFPGFGASFLKQEPTDEWLSQINRDLSARDVPPEKRPGEAVLAYQRASGYPCSFGSARVKRIYRWFEDNTKPGAHLMPPFMLFAYYFDASFWPSPIPVIFGAPAVNPYDSLRMPPQILERLSTDHAPALQYQQFWAMCYDYAYGTDDFLKQTAADFASHLAAAGRDQVAAAAALLLEQRPNVRALEASALGGEMLLKLFLAVRDGLTDRIARTQYSHGIPDLLVRCVAIAPGVGFESVQTDVTVFPPIAERYQQVQRSLGDLWRGYRVAVQIGAVVMNELTDRHVSRQLRAF